MSNIKVTNPWLFLVLIPLFAVVIIGFCLLPKQKKRRPKNIISFILHLAMCVTLTLAFVDIQNLHTSVNTEVYILADCSVSTEKSAEKMDQLIQDVYTQASQDNGTKIGVVAFAKNQEVMVKAGDNFNNKSVAEMYDTSKHPEFDASATDLKSALLYTNDLFDEEAVKRMIVISDGIETDNSAVEALDTLISNDIHVDAIAFNDDEYDEVAITGLDYIDHAFINRDEDVKVSIRAKKQTTINVELLCDGEIIDKKEGQTAGRGLNVLSFPLDTSSVGSFKYEVRVTSSNNKDTYSENNCMRFNQDVTDKFNVLYITPNSEDKASVEALGLYTSSVKIDWYIDTEDVPYTIEDLLKYDEIVLSDVDISTFAYPDEFAANLNTVVSVYGKSLMTFGATYSGTATDDYVTDYNDMLPVQYESDEGKAIVLLIDNSGSMYTDGRLDKAKKGCSAIVDTLSDRDYISIVTFSDSAKVVQPLTSAKNKTQIKRAINKITDEGGTEMGKGLTAAGNQIKDSKMENKYIITLSDGDPFDTESSLYSIVKRYAAYDISLSFINISNPSGAALLKRLALYGNGSYYYCRTANSLIDTMLTAVVTDMGNKAIDCDDPADITVRTPEDPALKEITSLPTIWGYNYCRIKGAATTVLTVQYVSEDEQEGTGEVMTAVATIPLYAHWEYGKGKVSSFTSSISSEWTDSFRNTTDGKLFLQQMALQALPDRKSDNMLDVSYKTNGITTSIYVTASDANKTGKVHLTVTDPENNNSEYDLYYDGTQYTCLIDSPIIGEYQLVLDYSYEKADGTENTVTVTTDPVNASFYFDYSSEYDLFGETNSDMLYELTANNGTVSYNEVKYSREEAELAFKSYKTTMMWFFFISVLLFLIDVFIRKSDFKGKKKKAPIAPVNPVK